MKKDILKLFTLSVLLLNSCSSNPSESSSSSSSLINESSSSNSIVESSTIKEESIFDYDYSKAINVKNEDVNSYWFVSLKEDKVVFDVHIEDSNIKTPIQMDKEYYDSIEIVLSKKTTSSYFEYGKTKLVRVNPLGETYLYSASSQTSFASCEVSDIKANVNVQKSFWEASIEINYSIIGLTSDNVKSNFTFLPALIDTPTLYESNLVYYRDNNADYYHPYSYIILNDSNDFTYYKSANESLALINGKYNTTSGFDIKDNSNVSQIDSGEQKAFFNVDFNENFYVETSVRYSGQRTTWLMPKYGLALKGKENDVFYYVDSTNNGASKEVGLITLSAGSYSNDSLINVKNDTNLTTKETKLGLLKIKDTIYCLVNNEIAFKYTNIYGIDKAIPYLLTFDSACNFINPTYYLNYQDKVEELKIQDDLGFETINKITTYEDSGFRKMTLDGKLTDEGLYLKIEAITNKNIAYNSNYRDNIHLIVYINNKQYYLSNNGASGVLANSKVETTKISNYYLTTYSMFIDKSALIYYQDNTVRINAKVYLPEEEVTINKVSSNYLYLDGYNPDNSSYIKIGKAGKE